MIDFTSYWYDPDVLIYNLAKHLGKEPMISYSVSQVYLEPEQGEGCIKGFKFRCGLTVLFFDVKPNRDWRVNFEYENTPPLQMTYVLEGDVTHEVADFKKSYQIKPMESTIVSCPVESRQFILFEAEKRLMFAILQINKEEYFGPYYHQQGAQNGSVNDVFFDIYGGVFFFELCSFPLETSTKLKELFEVRTDDIANIIIAEAITSEIIGQKIRLISQDNYDLTRKVKLSNDDLAKIKEAKEILEVDLKDPPTILELSKKVGINQQKLKVGFKEVFEITIKTFVIQKRMEKAGQLISDGLSVKAAMNKIGYTNLGYFSKRFKEYFGVLPKDLKKQINNKITIKKQVGYSPQSSSAK